MILKTQEDFIRIIPTAASTPWEQFEAYVSAAEFWIRKEILGNVLYNSLDTSVAPEHTDIIAQCRRIIALDAYQRAIPFLDIVQTGSGFGVVSNDNLAPASKERVNRLIQQSASQRDEAVENLLDLLEVADTATLDAWKGSKAYSLLSDCIIVSTAEFKRLTKWNGSRSDFVRLKPVIQLKTKMEIESWTGHEFIDLLIEQQRDNDVTEDNRLVLDLLKLAVACFVNGLSDDGQRVRAEAVNLMDANLDAYPLYRDCKEYKIRHRGETLNTEGSSMFFMGGI